MKEGKTRYAILGLLTEGPMSGYTIKKLVDARFHLFWSESYGQLYPELGALVREGLVAIVPAKAARAADEQVARASAEAGGVRGSAEATAARPRGTRERTAYAISPAGRAALRAWLERPAERESVRMELLLKLYFAGCGERAWLIPQLEAFEARHAAELALLGRFEAELSRIPDPDGSHADALRVLGFGRRTCEGYVEWARETRQALVGADERESEGRER